MNECMLEQAFSFSMLCQQRNKIVSMIYIYFFLSVAESEKGIVHVTISHSISTQPIIQL